MTANTVCFSFSSPPILLCSILLLLLLCLTLSSPLTSPRLPLYNNAFVSLIPSPALLFDCRHPCVHSSHFPDEWLINLTHSVPGLDFDIVVTTLLVSDLLRCVWEHCACATCWHWIMTAQLIEHFLKLDMWQLDFQIAGACSFFVLFFSPLWGKGFLSLLNNIFCCCAESPPC